MFGLKKSKPSEGAELVLAYLEDAQRVRAAILLVDGRGREVPATLSSVAEDRVALAPQGPLTVEKGAGMSLVFILDGLRFKAATKVIEVKPGQAALELPGSIALAERRKRPRARINPREGATATALTGLFDGVGVSGAIENISESGMCIRVDRAMDVKTQRNLRLAANVMPVGQPLMLIKLNKLPKCPSMEVAGAVSWVEGDQGLLLGIAFESGKEGVLAPVKSLVSSRAGAIPSSVPPKARRQPDTPREEEPRPASRPEPKPAAPASGAPPAAEPHPPAPKADEVPPAPAPAAQAEPAAPPAEAPAVDEPPALDDRALALLRVKKRARGLLLAMPPGPHRDATIHFLNEDGYGRILYADTLTLLLEHLERPGTHLVLIDGGVAELQGLQLAALVHARLEDATPIILAETSVDTELVLGAQDAGVSQILVKPYELDAEFRRMVETHLGLL